VNQGVTELLTRTALLDLELAKILQGQQAYKYLQDMQSYYQEYTDMAARSGAAADLDAWHAFYSDVIQRYKFPEHLDIVKMAVTTPLLEKDSLLGTFVRGILIKARAGQNSVDQELELYNAYETYVSSILIELRKGCLLYSHAILFFEMRGAHDKTITRLPINGTAWAARRDDAIKQIVHAFLSELVWLILGLSWPAVGGNNPYFLVPAAREMVARPFVLPRVRGERSTG
jgi:hypothetical protein